MSFDKALELIHPILPSLDEVEETLNFTTASSKLLLSISSLIKFIFSLSDFSLLLIISISDKLYLIIFFDF